jgi:serine/threonine protein kinase
MPAPGAVLAGRYRIIAPLGSGGMATVQRARDERLERDVAVKVLLPNHAGDPVLATRFEREARSLAAAAHPGVVAVYDVDPGDPAAGIEPFFVMELCSGGSLADRLAGGRRLSPDDLIPILISVADGLAGLHARGVVHRDVKPSNILLAPTRAKLADFGLARSDDPAESSDLTAPGTAVGTMAYLAPDVLAGGIAGPAGDVYALGVAAFAGLTGSMPRQASSIAELVAAGGQPVPLVSSIAPDLGTAFDQPVGAALDADPANRPDALSLAAALTTALGRWSRGRRSPSQWAAPAPADLDATTATAPMEAPTARVDATAAADSRPPAQDPSASRRNLVGAAIVAALIVAALALAGGGPDDVPPGASVAASAIAAATASPSLSISPSPSPSPVLATPSPTPVPPPSVTERALAAMDEVDAAIAAARRNGGLKGKDANELERRAREVRSALASGDLEEAAERARSLANAVEKLSDEMDDNEAERLANAVSEVIDILRDR